MKIHFILVFHLFNFSYEIELKLRYLKKKEYSLGIKEKIILSRYNLFSHHSLVTFELSKQAYLMSFVAFVMQQL